MLVTNSFLKTQCRTSLVAQRIRTRLPMQETQVQFLVQEDPTYLRATKPTDHHWGPCALGPMSHNEWASVPPGSNSTWTVNFQMFKLHLEMAEEPEIKLPPSTGSLKKQENIIKISVLPKEIYRFNAVFSQIPTVLFAKWKIVVSNSYGIARGLK